MKLNSLSLAAALLAATLATGCATKAQTGALVGAVAGAAIAGPAGGSVAAHWGFGIAGAAVGGVVGGAIGRYMDQNDISKARAAVTTNETKTWTNSSSNTTYTVTPKDNGDGSSTVKTDMTREGKTTSETVRVQKPLKE